MLFIENVRLALSSLRANKMRSLLTMLGIIIGISSVIAIMTVGNSITRFVSEEFASYGASNIYVIVQQRPPDDENVIYYDDYGDYYYDGEMEEHIITESDCMTRSMIEDYCEEYKDEVKAVSATQYVGRGQIKDGNLYANINLYGYSTGSFYTENIKLAAGRYFRESEYSGASDVAIISDRAVKNMFGGNNEEALGSTIQIYIDDMFYDMVVVGVYTYEENNYSFGMSTGRDVTTDVYIPLKTAQELVHWDVYNYITVMVNPDVNPTEFAKTTRNFFNIYYRNNEYFQITAFSLASQAEQFMSMISTITLAISVIAGIALLVGGIGVMNIMLVSITERTREIGTRKALGAPNSSIRLQFIVEAVVICLIGGMIGIVLGIIMGCAASALLETPAVPSLSSIVISLTFSMAIGVFFGYYPANKAAKMDPIEALRYE